MLTAAELQVETALRSVLRADGAIALDAHFFQDLGGDSLLAAELVTHLRTSAEAASLTVRDAYEAPTIASLAERMASAGPREEVMRVRPSFAGRPWLVTLVQCVWLTLGVMAASALDLLRVLRRGAGGRRRAGCAHDCVAPARGGRRWHRLVSASICCSCSR